MNGIDVSHYQGIIDWGKVAQNTLKIDFAFIKASTGIGSSDGMLKFNASEARKYGFKIGYYHFASLNNYSVAPDAKAEAEWFLKVISGMPKPDLPLILDIEAEDPKIQLSDEAVLLWINTFFLTLKNNGYANYALYSYTPFLDTHLPVNHNLGSVPLWIAAYTNLQSPRLPRGWKDYWIWQYSSKGSVKGIKTNVDLNKTSQPI